MTKGGEFLHNTISPFAQNWDFGRLQKHPQYKPYRVVTHI